MKMMDLMCMKDIEELTVCSLCQNKFNNSDATPKLLFCRHYFCLSCIKSRMMNSNGILCANCWKKTDLPDSDPTVLPTYNPILALAENFPAIKHSVSSDNSNGTIAGRLTNGTGSPDTKKTDTCQVHAMPLSLWCQTCSLSACRACTSQPDHAHHGHQITSQMEVTERFALEIQAESTAINNLINDIHRLMSQRRSFLLKVLESCVTLKTYIETDVQVSLSQVPEVEEARSVMSRTQATLPQIENINEAHHLYSNLVTEKQKLQMKCQELFEQCHINYVVKNSHAIFDVSLMKHVLDNINSSDSSFSQQFVSNNSSSSFSSQINNSLLLLSNYCIWLLCNKSGIASTTTATSFPPAPPPLPSQHRNMTSNSSASSAPSSQQQMIANTGAVSCQQYVHHNGLDYGATNSPTITPPNMTNAFPSVTELNTPLVIAAATNHVPPPPVLQQATVAAITPAIRSPFPIYYFNIDVNSTPFGRIMIEIRPDIAPKMAKNFSALTTGELGYGYKGCNIFQCWDSESIITGDFELNNGRGGRSIYEEAFFIPDDTKVPARRGAVGMRRTQKKHDSLGMVGSQFRIILREMRGFTAIFGQVVEGIELVEKISSFGDQAGKPSKSIVIVNCGKL